MQNFEATRDLVKSGLVDEIGAGEAKQVVGGLIIVVCLKDAPPLADTAKVTMQDFHFVM